MLSNILQNMVLRNVGSDILVLKLYKQYLQELSFSKQELGFYMHLII